MDNGSYKYARDLLESAFATGQFKGNHPATLAALSLIKGNWENAHPSLYNTQFAVGAFFLDDRSIPLYAWRMVLNGLGGYWQWDTHNGGHFSVTDALVHLGVITEEESSQAQHRFNWYETDSNCKYFLVKEEFLARLVEKFNLPILNQSIGGKKSLTREEFEEYWKAMSRHGVDAVRAENRARYEKAFASM